MKVVPIKIKGSITVYEQYYYYLLYLMREMVNQLSALWNCYVRLVHAFPEFAITVMLVGILTLIVISVKRNIRVTYIKGDEISRLIKAIRREEE